MEVLEEDADDLRFDLNDVVIHRSLQDTLVKIERLAHELLILALIVGRTVLVEELILTISEGLRKVVV